MAWSQEGAVGEEGAAGILHAGRFEPDPDEGHPDRAGGDHAQDRRAQQIHLTVKGTELVQRAEKIASTMEAPALRMLSPAERALLIELLMKVSEGKTAKRA